MPLHHGRDGMGRVRQNPSQQATAPAYREYGGLLARRLQPTVALAHVPLDGFRPRSAAGCRLQAAELDPVLAVVQAWNGDEEWGVCLAEQFPGGCWLLFSSIDVPGYRHLTVEETVRLVAEVGDQGGYDFRPTWCWLAGAGSLAVEGKQRDQATFEAYVSQLDLCFGDKDPPAS